jgi:CheY-like chemotaxis protein
VLIVEDNVTNAKVLLKMLEGMQAEVVVAQDGRKALEELERRTFDLILMDCQMPIMDGLEATRKIRQREENLSRHTPIIALTADSRPEDRDRCIEAGMDEYMTKPLSRQILIEKIQGVLSVE